MTGLVTGEAVLLDLRLAKLPSRALAFLLDLFLQVVVLIVAVIGLAALGSAAGLDDALMFALVLATVVAIIVGYPTLMETLTGGRTLGKMALGLRVVRADGGPIRFRHALVRGLCGALELWMFGGCIAVITSLINSQGQRVGDLLAGTVAVAERQPLRQAHPPIAMPPGLEGWAATLDLTALREADAAAARSVVHRWHHLSPVARQASATTLAQRIATQVSPTAPPGVPAVAYLSAVLAERTRRTLAAAPAAVGAAGMPGAPGPSAAPAPAQPAPTWVDPTPPAASPSSVEPVQSPGSTLTEDHGWRLG